MKKKFNENLKTKLPIPILDAVESIKILALKNGKKVLEHSDGPEYIYYDLASLTKPVFTVSCFMKLVEEDPSILKLSVGEILGWENYLDVKIEHLLTHQSGLVWWKPFFENSLCLEKGREGLATLLQNEKPQPSSEIVYSDLDFITLGFVLEELLGENLEHGFLRLQNSWKSNDLHFNPIVKGEVRRKFSQDQYAPTFSHQFKKEWVQGVVNDGNAQVMGGVSSHAGLFGSLADLQNWLLEMRASYLKNQGPYSQKIVKKFFKRATPKDRGDWSLGFMLPSRGGSSSGQYFSKNSIGHLGFTGVSFWWDLNKDIQIVILSNRYIQSKSGEQFKILRPLLHDTIMEQIL